MIRSMTGFPAAMFVIDIKREHNAVNEARRLNIPIVAIVSRTVTKMMELKEKQLQVQTTMTAEKAAQYASHVERLEQRVRVLERIATDANTGDAREQARIAAEIEALRAQPDSQGKTRALPAAKEE